MTDKPKPKSNSNCMLTTIDNPYNPFNQYDEWLAYDTSKGYHTCAYLARIALTSEELTETDETLAIEQAMDDIVSINITGKYLKVTPDSFIKRVIKKESS